MLDRCNYQCQLEQQEEQKNINIFKFSFLFSFSPEVSCICLVQWMKIVFVQEVHLENSQTGIFLTFPNLENSNGQNNVIFVTFQMGCFSCISCDNCKMTVNSILYFSLKSEYADLPTPRKENNCSNVILCSTLFTHIKRSTEEICPQLIFITILFSATFCYKILHMT